MAHNIIKEMTDDSEDIWCIFHEDKVLLFSRQDHLILPSRKQITSFISGLNHHHELGIYNGRHCFCAELTDLPAEIKLEWFGIRKALDALGWSWYYTLTRAHSVINWDKNHRFCGRCSKQTEHKPNSFERICSHCGLFFYPRISPSIIVLIHKGEELLMARGHHFVKGAFGFIAGFVEAGETLEDAVHREVKEEVGIEVRNLNYFGSQPWPFPDSLMVGFFAEYASGEIIVDTNELESAAWYRYNNLPGTPSNLSISKRMLDYYLAQFKAPNNQG